MRKVQKFTIQDEGRDKGKTFQITELPALEAERWAVHALLAMSRNGVDIPESALDSGFAALAAMGVNMLGKLKAEDADVLMAKMMDCVMFASVGNGLQPRPLVESDIEEILTLFRLRKEVLTLHAGFLKAVMPSTTA
jgi:hypothetical protein